MQTAQTSYKPSLNWGNPIVKPTQEFQDTEYKALRYSGLKISDEIASFDVPISTDSWVHEIRCGFQNKEDVVLLHGYGGTGMTFLRVFKDLTKRYKVHALDFLGMGLSHRKTYNHESDHLESISYYVDSIELWRQEVGVKSFVLAGHSFGGYLAACYAKQYPNRVQRLVLISPPGVMYMDSNMGDQMFQQLKENSSFGRKTFLSIAKSLVNSGTTPSSIMNWPILGDMFVDRVLTGRLGLENQQKQTYKQYMKTVSTIQPNSERAFFKIFHFPKLGCQQSIEKIIHDNKFKFPIEFYYGDHDWMESGTARSLVNRRPNDNKLLFRTVENSGHQILFDNPHRMASFILQENMI